MLVPVVLVSGFLGSGKTTFLRSLLQNTEGIRLAVVRNEFIDQQDLSLEVPLLVEEVDGMTLLEFPNSCVCCSAKTAFVESVHNLVLNRKEKGNFDVIVVELSGLTDPIAVGDEFISSADPARDMVEFRKVITIMDCSAKNDSNESTQKHLLKRFTVAADLIFLNKVDKASPSQIRNLEAYVNSINPGCRTLQTHLCAQMSATALVKFAKEAAVIAPREQLNHQIGCLNLHNINQHVIHENIIIRSDALESLESAIGVWLWSDDLGSIWRGKGLLKLNSGGWAELQICEDSIALNSIDWSDPKGESSSDCTTSFPSQDPWTRVMLIGTRSDLSGIKDVLLSYT